MVMRNKAILFYFNILKCASPVVLINLQCPTTQLCVSKCPDRFATYLDMQYAYRYNKSYWEYYRQFCKPGFNNPKKSIGEVLRDEDCPSMLVPSRPFLQRCFPDFTTRNGVLTVANKTTFKDGRGKTRNVTDLREAAKGLVIAMVVSLLFILLLRYTAGVLLWVIIFGVIGVIGYGILHCYWEFRTLRGKPGADVTISDIGFQTDFRVYLQLSQTWLIFMICLCIIEATIILILIFLRNRVRIAIALLKEGSKGLVIAMVVSLLFILLLRYTAGVLLWVIIFGVIGVIGYGILHCYWEFSTLRGKPGADVTISDIGFQTDFRVYLQLSQTWLIFMICLCIIEATIILILIFLRNRVRIAIALLKEGSKAIGHIMSTLFYPIITFLLIAICISYWAVTAMYPIPAL
ncbi:UNVERIFIED_CONTAM: hypothetical protein FKN15_048838 [Acipenser sinensis]